MVDDFKREQMLFLLSPINETLSAKLLIRDILNPRSHDERTLCIDTVHTKVKLRKLTTSKPLW